MSLLELVKIGEVFKECQEEFFSDLLEDEKCTLSLSGEKSHFVRFNGSKVRQTTNVEQGELRVQLVKGRKSVQITIPFTESVEQNKNQWQKTLKELRYRSLSLPDDPFIVVPKNNGTSVESYDGNLLRADEIITSVLEPAQKYDMAGIFASGPVFRGNANSEGQYHWFESKSFSMDYSFYDRDQNAVKGSYAGAKWDQQAYQEKLIETGKLLALMKRPRKSISRGQYRVYLAPGAVAELLGILSWGGVSRSAYEQGHCAFSKFFKKEVSLSERVNLSEDFSLGLSQRFNKLGEVAEEKMNLIEKGRHLELLTSTRTAKEFQVQGNNAGTWEQMRSPVLATGGLAKDGILETLGTGLFLSNLHYLNWSDRMGARVTGMTRYACFWVEKGEIIAPIKDLRFDESYYRFWGEECLVDFTNFSEVQPRVGTYGQREIGGGRCPGMLVDNFTFTL